MKIYMTIILIVQLFGLLYSSDFEYIDMYSNKRVLYFDRFKSEIRMNNRTYKYTPYLFGGDYINFDSLGQMYVFNLQPDTAYYYGYPDIQMKISPKGESPVLMFEKHPVGYNYEIVFDGMLLSVELLSKNDFVMTPYGNFSSTIHFKISIVNGDDVNLDIWIKPRFGIVRWDSGIRDYRLNKIYK